MKVDAVGDDDRAKSLRDLFKRKQRRGHERRIGHYSAARCAFAA
jgi:hypothetical protein